MIIFHGEDQKRSRAEFIETKKKLGSKYQLIDLNGGDCLLVDIINASNTDSLFGEQNLVVLENIFSRRPSNEKKSILQWLEGNQKVELLIWEGKDVSTQLKKFSPQTQKKYDLPKYVFHFLDTFAVKELQLALSVTEPEVIVSLLAKRITDVLFYSSGDRSMPPWQQAKIKFLAEKFQTTKIIELNNDLLELDYRQKNSLSPLTLAQGLEVLFIKFNN